MFDGVPLGTPRVSLARARELVEEVDALMEWDGDGLDDFDAIDRFDPAALHLAGKAEAMGAHSVARALRWSTMWLPTSVLERPDFVEWHNERPKAAARRWLARQEARR